MTNPDYTHLSVIVDRSGSMAMVAADMRGGIDTFFKTQAELEGTCLVDYAQFDDMYEVVYEDRPVEDAMATLSARGGTALLDAIGKTVTNLGQKLAAKSEDDRPGKVIVLIVTDGAENSSREWTAPAVKELVTQQQDEWNWEFVFLGANIDAVTTGSLYGFSPGSTLTYDTANANAAFAAASGYTTRTRSGLVADFTDDERNAQGV